MRLSIQHQMHLNQCYSIVLKNYHDLCFLCILKIQLDDRAMEYLAQKGYDPAFGARPLKRVIQQEIENPLSMAILKGEFNQDDTVEFGFDENEKKLIIDH